MDQETTFDSSNLQLTSPGHSAIGLPVFLSSFVGREQDVERVTALLLSSEVRLVTITGFGGMGKTRLATTVAERSVGYWRYVWVVSLAHIHEASAASAFIARELEIEDDEQLASRAARHALASAPCLLVLDNFEHLVDAADQISDLLLAWPLLTILITSRAPLNLSGEHVYGLLPLSVESDGTLSSAVQLFVDRARARDQTFCFSSANEPAIRHICQRLEGIPLAIELAAARVPMLTLAELRDRLTSQLTLLTGGPRDAPARQRTLRDTIAWSYALLSPEERVALLSLSVFSGGFTLEAAGGVLDIPLPTMMDRLAALIASSLVISAPSSLIQTMRYRLLDPVREFAFDQLSITGRAHAVQLAHARFYTSFAENALPLCDGPELPRVLRACCAEIENFRVAIAWSLEHGDREDGVRLAGAIWRHWPSRLMGEQIAWTDRMAEGRRWIRLALEHAEGLPLEAVREAHLGRMYLEANLKEVDEDLLTTTDQIWAWAADEDDAYTMCWIAYFRWRANIDFAKPFTNPNEVLDYLNTFARCVPHPINQEAGNYMSIGSVLRALGQGTEAEPFIQRAHELALQCGNPLYISETSLLTAECLMDQGDLLPALELLRDAIRLQDPLGEYYGTGRILVPVARIAITTGRPDLAIPLLACYQHSSTHLNEFDPQGFHAALDELREAASPTAVDDIVNHGEPLTPDSRELLLDELQLHLVQNQTCPHQADGPDLLTPREFEVLRLLARGESNRGIASHLFISERTVENHVRHILARLDVPNRAAASAWAARHDLA